MWLVLVVVILFFLIFNFTIVKEGTAKAVVRFGEFREVFLAWKDYHLDRDWTVVDGRGREWMFGGLRFVGIRGIDKIYTYKFRWRDVQLAGKEEIIEFHEQILDYVFVRPDVYVTDIKGAETVPPERIPLDIQFLVTMKVINPYKALFKAPSNWNENVLSRLNALFRDWVGTQKYDTLLEIKADSEKLWEKFKEEHLIKDVFKDGWGIEILGIQMREITPPKEIREAGAREKQQELEAKGRISATVGLVLDSMATARGKTVADIQALIDADNTSDGIKSEFFRLSNNLIVREQALAKNALVDIRVEGAGGGFERMLLNALAVWQRVPKGSSPAAGKKAAKVKMGGEEFEVQEEG